MFGWLKNKLRTKEVRSSPYLEHPQRLADIMAAIQVMGTHLWDTRPVEHWKTVLGEKPLSVKPEKWDLLFYRHPEFFGKEIWREKKEKEGIEVLHDNYYLRWSRSLERTVDVESLRELTSDEIAQKKKDGSYNQTKLALKLLMRRKSKSC